ncbi:hypothetical protein RIVM261_044870 [Rivularia sp. IAM M-261]|nr:hypothetical protein CAL7716_086510 [Calothrix sp. PCC 7716]GJD19531.1 hypothetical protein RIVM261_044870 [Rivularia sp. IAM M-261]
MTVNQNEKRLLMFVTCCAMAGLVVGGVSGFTNKPSCNDNIQCLTEDTLYRTVKGMTTGLGGGVGAAFAIHVGMGYKD